MTPRSRVLVGTPQCDALEARINALADPDASPERWHYLANRLAAARMAAELAEMEAGA